MNKLYFGDCLDVLRSEIADESVDLIYLDPPFNSSRNYNLLFKAPSGHRSEAQVGAFQDTWHWGEQAESEFHSLLTQPNAVISEVITSLRRFLGENDMMAYITMMANRLAELHRALSSRGSLYLHCDSNASHYLRVVLDAVFGPDCFRNEIIWKRSTAHSDAKAKYAAITDTLLFYGKSKDTKFNVVRTPLDPEYVDKFYRYTDENGRRYRLGDMSAPEGGGMAAINKQTGRPNGWYVWKGYQPPQRGWRFSPETMQKLHDEGRLQYPDKPDGRISIRRYLDENEGAPVSCLWDDITAVQGASNEYLGYPTQKPLALLERIIEASSDPTDTVLDPFCGCGTAVHAAQKLGRQWIGIDITHLAITLIEKRLQDAFPKITFEVFGTPKDIEGARNLSSRDKYQFQWWACSLVGAQPWQSKKKGADRGIDGIIYFQDEKGIPKKIIVSVKGGESVGRAMIADLKNSVEREKAQIGLFVTLAPPTREMVKEALSAGFYESPMFKSSEYPKIQILTIEGLLDGTQRPRYPDLSQGAYTFKRANQELNVAESNTDLFNEG